jgi:hypothetical protein
MAPLVRFGATAAATLLAAGAVGAWPTLSAAGEAGLLALAAAGAVALLGAVAGFVPLAQAHASSAPMERKAQAALAGVLVRLLVTGAGVGAVLALGLVDARGAFLLWTAIDYALLLALETRAAVSIARAGGPASA